MPLICVPLCPQLGYAAERKQSPSFLDLSCTPVGPRWCPARVNSLELSAKDKIISHVVQGAKTQETADRLSITVVFGKMLAEFSSPFVLSRRRPHGRNVFSPPAVDASGESFLYLVFRLHFTQSPQGPVSPNETINKTR